MNIEKVAKVVHELVQRDGKVDLSKTESVQGMTAHEQEAITEGFSKLRLSGDSVAIEVGPYVHWA